MTRRLVLLALVVGISMSASPQTVVGERGVTRETLDNGLRVVIIRDSLAPVVTVENNYLVGADETPPDFPGLAHAQEHMAFRGCDSLSGDQTSAIYAELGGYGNADTQQTITQYFATVPAGDLQVALRVDASCMRNIEDSEAEWSQEKGAIEQEVARDLSEPAYKFITRLNEDMFAGTPYNHDALGTRESFEKTTGEMLKKFYNNWYAPNNAILVVAGDVDPNATLATIKNLYGNIPRREIPARQTFSMQSVKQEAFTLDSNLPYLLVLTAYRLPGSDSPDFAAARILADVLASQRGDIYGLVPAGKALEAGFELFETYPKASVGASLATLPAGSNAAEVTSNLQDIIANYVKIGLPVELVEAAKRSEIAGAEFERNSIPGLAALWSDALAAEGRHAPDDDLNAIRRVTVADVDRVARQYLLPANSITGTLVPQPSDQPGADKGFGGGEQLTSAPSQPVQLPDWAESALSTLQVPQPKVSWAESTLPNGIRLIVKTDRTSPTITVLGSIKHENHLQTPDRKEGVDDVLAELLSYGTKKLNRIAFQKSLDDIAATETAGYEFSVKVLKAEFSRGVELLAQNELEPALPEDAFHVVQKELADFVAGRMKSPGYLTDRAVLEGLLPSGDAELRQPTQETIAGLTLSDVVAFHHATFRPDLTTIVVIGDVEAATAKATIEKWFGAWKTSGPKPNVVLPKVTFNQPAARSVPDRSSQQASVTLAQEVPVTRFDPDYYALQLGDHVLGGGFYATRLYHDLRQEAGLVYSVDDTLVPGESRTVYMITYGCDPQNVDKARDLIERDLRAMQTANVTAQELHRAKAILLRQLPLRESSEEAVARGLLARAQIGLPLDEPAHGGQKYFALTADQVREAFARNIRPDGLVRVVRGPAAQ